MDEENKNNPTPPQDFGMEDIENPQEQQSEKEGIKINNYLNEKTADESQATTEQPATQQTAPPQQVDPSAAAPPETPASQPSPEPQPSQQPTPVVPQSSSTDQKINISQAKNTGAPQQTPPQKTTKKTANPAAKRKALLGCLGAFILVVVIILVLAFVFISQGISEDNPLAELLGVNQAAFINGLITLVNIIFLLVGLGVFVIGAVNFFKAAMAKKDDKETKKKGIKYAVISLIVFFIISIIWGFVFVWLDPKRVNVDEMEILPPIVTEPEETLGLTAPVEIRFDASNVPYDDNQFQILSYKWDFDDGDTGTNQIITHEYKDKGENDGRYNVLLTVTFRDKETGEEITQDYEKIITISDQAISAIFTADPQEGEAPLKVKFDASDSVDPDGTIDTYEWDFDEDGEYDDEEGEEVEYEFEKVGKYTVGLRVTSTTGDFAVGELQIVVEEESKPEAVITINDEPDSFLVGEQYVFSASDSTSPNGEITEYEWDFGDGSSTVKNRTANHTFDSDGTYTVTLTVTDEEDKEGEATKSITVGALQGTPKAVIKTDPTMSGGALSLNGSAPFTVVFDAEDSTDSDNNIVDYEWDFDGDGVVDGYGAKSSHTFTAAGTYNTKLEVIDSDGNSGESTIVVQVDAQGITANIVADKVDGSVPLTVNFDASGSSYPGEQIVSYTWDFGDGSAPKSGTSKISHKYTEIGAFTATVTAYGADNSSSTADILITIREIPLQACFTSVFTEGEAPLTTTFDPGCSTGTIAAYTWDFGDGNISTGVKPTHTFQSSGQYNVNLEITDADNTVSTFEILINVTN